MIVEEAFRNSLNQTSGLSYPPSSNLALCL
jgi:hypothetical protein